MKKKCAPKKRRVVEIVRSDYQPSKAELEEDMSLDASFEELVQTVAELVEIKDIPRPKQNEWAIEPTPGKRLSALLSNSLSGWMPC